MAVLDSIDEAIHVVDKKGITIFYNSKAASLDGLLVDEVIGKHITEVFPSLDRDTSTLLKVLKTKKPIFNQQQSFSNYRRNRVVTVNSTLPIFRHGEIIGAVEVSKDITQLKFLSEKVAQLQQMLYSKNQSKKEQKPNLYQFGDIVGENNNFMSAVNRAQKVARTDSPVLVSGETGVGKELIVQSIHTGSVRQNRPFVTQNCAAMPENLLEGLLFGTTKGSFTGASDRPGLFELADNGTLFLDEINSMPLPLQAKLLRVLEDQKIRRVGGMTEKKVDTRVIAAMNVDANWALEKNILRKDLYFRLSVVNIHLPSLKDRRDDILPLAKYFLEKYNTKFKTKVRGFEDEVVAALSNYDWPGNVRELSNCIEGMLNFKSSGKFSLEDLPLIIQQSYKPRHIKQGLKDLVAKYEKEAVLGALIDAGFNISKAARSLDIPRQTLQYKIKQHQIKI
ncbi:sigma 54-interacting transcriptional regulator [Proteinivorax hydrogeniformans]|uniref:Sigma 54-interacting transcriptional regulator n=2 Tax=Proteinivorax hydrogeniformans TaxID=1826727 RepID=A0AAU8HXC9_9FIRM